jgi:chromosome segregation ATPase
MPNQDKMGKKMRAAMLAKLNKSHVEYHDKTKTQMEQNMKARIDEYKNIIEKKNEMIAKLKQKIQSMRTFIENDSERIAEEKRKREEMRQEALKLEKLKNEMAGKVGTIEEEKAKLEYKAAQDAEAKRLMDEQNAAFESEIDGMEDDFMKELEAMEKAMGEYNAKIKAKENEATSIKNIANGIKNITKQAAQSTTTKPDTPAATE